MHTLVPKCHHIFPDGHRCGSPSVRSQAFCYYHHPDRLPVANPYARRARRGFQLTPPTDRRSLQLALGEILVRLGTNQIDTHRASLMLYTLQIASRSLNR